MHGYALRKPTHSIAASPADHPVAAEVAPALSFTDVFERHAAYVLGLLRRLGVDDPDVEDVAQDVFITVHEKLPGFEGRSALKTWLCGICLRKASDYRRRAHRRREALTAAPEAEAAGTPEAHAQHHEHVVLLERALAALPDKQRDVFVLYELEELAMADVARLVGCPRFTAYTRLHAARERVRDFVAQASARARNP